MKQAARHRIAGLLVGIAALSVAGVVAAQSSSEAGARRSRAPLADVDLLEPAVDVGGELVRRPTAPGADTPTVSERAVQAGTTESGERATAAAERRAAVAAPPGNARVTDSLDLGTTSITGNQELPKVLYIVPWKKSDLGELVGRPVNTLLDEVLTPVDPEVFERHLDYYETLYGVREEE